MDAIHNSDADARRAARQFRQLCGKAGVKLPTPERRQRPMKVSLNFCLVNDHSTKQPLNADGACPRCVADAARCVADPTEEQIQTMLVEIQAGWTAEERHRRTVGLAQGNGPTPTGERRTLPERTPRVFRLRFGHAV